MSTKRMSKMDALKVEPFTLLPLPTSQWRKAEAEKLRSSMAEDSYLDEGVRRWKANDTIIPPHVYKDACVQCPEGQAEAYSRHLDAFVADYKRRMENHVETAEERFERRAAFGPGVEVVNVLTGRRYTT